MVKTLVSLVGVAATVAALAGGLRWAVEISLIAEFEIEVVADVPPDDVMDFFIEQPDLTFLRSTGTVTKWNVVGTVQVSESVTEHTSTLSEAVPIVTNMDFTVITTCDREDRVVRMNATGLAWSGAVSLITRHHFAIQGLGGLQTRIAEHFKLYGPRLLSVFHRTAREVGEAEHRDMLTNLKKTLEKRQRDEPSVSLQ